VEPEGKLALVGTYIGISADAWGLVFGAIQTTAVVAALAFGVSQLGIVQRQRSADSLAAMHKEWREIESEAMFLLYEVPIFRGDLDGRALQLIDWIALCADQDSPASEAEREACGNFFKHAPLVINALSNLTAYMENSALREQDLLAQMSTRIMEVHYVLEPYLLLVSFSRQSRWGLRVRRLGIGAVSYYIRSDVQSKHGLDMRGIDVLPVLRDSISGFPEKNWRRKSYIPKMSQCAERDRQDIQRLGEYASQRADWERVAELLRKV
jgi:hypothetical protein